MFEFTVQDMTCGHCVATITKAVKQVEPRATVDADVQNHVLRIDGVTDGKAIEAAIREAGYTPQVLG